MKIMINYDFFNAVRNVREPFTPFKIIRNEKKKWMKMELPFFTTLELICFHDLHHLPVTVSIFTGTNIVGGLALNAMSGIDYYKELASIHLRNLVVEFQNLNLSTDYELLLQSDLYQKQYKIERTGKFPQLVENKYINVPTYTYNNDVKDTSILQEHVVGTKEYALSLGSPKKAFSYRPVSVQS